MQPDMNTPNAKGKTPRDYLLSAAQKMGLLGAQDRPAEGMSAIGEEPMQGLEGKMPVDKKRIEEAIRVLKEYKAGKSNLETRIVEEERWFKLRHWDVIRGKTQPKEEAEARPEPTSAWMFNSLANKHADIMDNYPEPNVLPRERADEGDAKQLSSILPVVFERNEYEATYDMAAWYKLKHGVVAKGVFWNTELEDGLGDVDIRFMDLLNIFWEPGITDLQASRNLFVVDLKDNDLLEQEYPQLKNKLGAQIIDVKQYVHDDNVKTDGKSVVVDWYYKKRTPEGRTVLHFCKFVGTEVLFASENEPENYPNGFYEHGRYPITFDVLFPEAGTPVGFGYIAVTRSPQMYIDKLSQAILENTVMSARPRYWAKKSAGINEEEFLDWNKPLAHYDGDPNNIQPIEVKQINSNVLNVLQMKIDELKETSSNRDFSQGGTGSGVTAAAAIAALQEAGNKTSRDMISSSYRSYTQECYIAIELIRQFYDEMRSFRITGDKGENEFVQFSNAGLQPKPIPPAYPGQELEMGYTPATRKPVFDVIVKPQKRSPYSKMAQNELAKELFRLGLFNPQAAEPAMTTLEMMDFDGLEKVKDKVQQGQTLMNQLMAMQQQLTQLAAVVAADRGMPMGGKAPAEGGKPAAPAHAPAPGNSVGRAVTNAQGGTMTSYGERLAAKAKPDMNAQ